MPTRHKARKPEIDGFFRKAIDYQGDDCLLWPFGKNKAGYGMISRDRKHRYVHRMLCEIKHGAAPEERPDAAHSCGNPACVNPHHLRWASHLENMGDRIAHGTTPRGRKQHFVKLTEDQVRQIKGLPWRNAASVAKEFGVSRPTIYGIWKGESWAWLPVPVMKPPEDNPLFSLVVWYPERKKAAQRPH